MQETRALRSDPQPSISIPEQPIGIELPPAAGKRIRLGFPVNEPSYSATHSDPEYAAVAFDHSVNFGRRPRRRIQLRQAKLPSPPPVLWRYSGRDGTACPAGCEY